MQIIVIGCGKVGSSLAAILVDQGHDLVIIENDKNLMKLADEIDCLKIIGVPIDRDILKQAGIETADLVCAVTQSDNINIMAAQIAREIFNVKKIITRVFNPISKELFDEFGLQTVCSTELTVQACLREIEGEENVSSHKLYGSQIVYSTLAADQELVGERLQGLTTDDGKLIFGLVRQGRLLLAAKDLVLEAGDQLVLAERL